MTKAPRRDLFKADVAIKERQKVGAESKRQV